MDLLLTNFSNIGNAIGWALIHFLWQGTLLFLAYWVVTRLFLKNKIHLQYWIGIAFISLCLIIPIREFSLQLTTMDYSIIHQLGISVELINSAGILNKTDLFIALVQKFIPYLVMFWGLSVILISTQLAKSWFALVKLSREPSNELPSYLVEKLNETVKKLKLKFRPIVTISQKISIPATFGFFKPVILLPTSLITRLPQDQMEAILLHELCHIKRADFLHNILQLLVETLFFYHPLAKWISKDVRKVREQCCDNLVLELKANPLVYANALTNIASIYNNSNGTSSHLQIAASDGELFNRIKILMVEKKSKSPMTILILGFLVTAITLLVFNNSQGKLQISNLLKTNKTNSFLGFETTNRPNYYNTPNIYSFINFPETKKHNSGITKINAVPLSTITKEEAKAVLPITIMQQDYKLEENKVKETISTPSITTVIESDNSKIGHKNTTLTQEPRFIQNNNNILTLENVSPRLIKKIHPKYRRVARKMGIEGTVILSFNINEKGRVKNISVDKSSPLKLLDGNARFALKQWRFDPKSMNDKNIKNRYQQIFSFNLNTEQSCTSGELGSHLGSNKNLCQDI